MFGIIKAKANSMPSVLCVREQKDWRGDNEQALKNKELADKIKKEEDALKQYFLRIPEENKEYYKKAKYSY